MEEGLWVQTFVQASDNPASCVEIPSNEGHITDFDNDVFNYLCTGECSCGALMQKGSCDVPFYTFCTDDDGMDCDYTFTGKEGGGACTVVEQGVSCEYDVTFTWSAEQPEGTPSL